MTTERGWYYTTLLPVNMSLAETNMEFQVLDMLATFNLLLRRSWLHNSEKPPSTLLRKVKMLIKGQVVTIEGDNLSVAITNKGLV